MSAASECRCVQVSKGDLFAATGAPDNLNFQYTRPQADLGLAEALSDHYSKHMGQGRLTADNFVATCGAQAAIFTTMQAFCNPGDEVAIITPAFDAHFKSASVLGSVSPLSGHSMLHCARV